MSLVVELVELDYCSFLGNVFFCFFLDSYLKKNWSDSLALLSHLCFIIFVLNIWCFLQVHIQSKKIDLSHVTSKCGSLDNIRHRPGEHANEFWKF